MRKFGWAVVSVALALCLAPNAWSQQTAAGATGSGAAQASAQGGAAPAVTIGTRFKAELKSTLDARKVRAGQQVTAVTTSNVKEDGRVVLPKGTKLLGHVTEVSAESHGHAGSSIGVLFDEAVTKKGEHIPIAAAISGVFRASSMLDDDMAMGPPNEPGMPTGGMPANGGERGGVMGGVASTAGATVNGAAGVAGGLPGMAGANGALGAGAGAAGQVTDSNGRPLGIQMPSLANIAAGTVQQGSVLTTYRGNLRVNAGTDVQLQVIGASAQGQANASSNASVH